MTKSQQIYPTDLNDTQWSRIRPYLPAEGETGRPREHGWYRILNGISYILQRGCSWQMLPRDLPPWKTAYHYFRLWRTNGTWDSLNSLLREKVERFIEIMKEGPPGSRVDESKLEWEESTGEFQEFGVKRSM